MFQALSLRLSPYRTARSQPVDPPVAHRSAKPARVAAPLPEHFARMHFDLGLTYVELGLPMDAIREWELSQGHPAFFEAARRMIEQVGGRGARHELAGSRALLDADVDRAFDDFFDLS